MPSALQPPDAPSEAERLSHVASVAEGGDIDKAARLAIEALAAGSEHPLLLKLRSLNHERAGRYSDALADLDGAEILAPRDPAILNARGRCLTNTGRHAEALACYDRALALEPRFGEAWFNRGFVLERLARPAEAERSYGEAVACDPRQVQAWANMAMLASRRGDAEALRSHAARALALDPGHATAILALANIDFTPHDEVEQSLRNLLKRPLGAFDRGLALGQLADALDAQGKAADAFGAYQQSNDVFARALAPRFAAPGQTTARDGVAGVVNWAEALEPTDWASDEHAGGDIAGERAHVFLLGFPRSGTTLMESVLGAHPDVVALEERPTLAEGVMAFLADADSLARLTTARGAALEPFRRAYWRCVRETGVNTAGKVFIDKNPWGVTKLPLIRKLFPQARILFAVRDPRDVVLSCFRRRFSFDPASYEFLDLRRTAAMYDLSMRLADLARRKLPFEEHLLNYEAFVTDLPGAAQAAGAFIGVDWRPEMAEVSRRARRGEVSSASSAQIARGLYGDGARHWRRYRNQLQPVAEMLAPWVMHFGYPAE